MNNSNNKRVTAAALIEAFAQQYQADRKETGRREGHRIFREWLTIIGLFLAAAVAAFQWRELRNTDHSIAEQAKIARDQLREMQSTGKQTDELIKATKQSADAARDAANAATRANATTRAQIDSHLVIPDQPQSTIRIEPDGTIALDLYVANLSQTWRATFM
jgi:methyl-accepting chemotaxis protein